MIPYSRQLIEEDDIEAVVEVLKSDFLTTGPKVEEFEETITQATGAKYAVAVSNGTAALHIAALSLLKEGDLVITTPNSFVATSNSILYAGARPIFVDIDTDGNIDLEIAEQLLKNNKHIKALFVVHFSGKMVNQEHLQHIKEKYGVKILEDCSHSLGASTVYKGEIVKSGQCRYSDCSTLSFHPVKIITTGEGGAVTTNDAQIYLKIKMLKNHGITRDISSFINKNYRQEQPPWYYEMQTLGFNYRISDIHCALGISQMKKLRRFIDERRSIAKRYEKLLNTKEISPLYTFSSDSSYHLYVIKIHFNKFRITRTQLMLKLREKRISTQVHYIPIPMHPYYSQLGYSISDIPKTMEYYSSCLSIPIYPGLTENEQEYVATSILSILNS